MITSPQRRSRAIKDIARKSFPEPFYKRGGGSTDLKIRRWRNKTLSGLIIVVTAFTGYYLFYSSYFEIKGINIPTTFYVSQNDIKEVMNEYFASKNILFMKRGNYFIVNTHTLANVLTSNYLLDELRINKKWPNNINITFIEKPSLLIEAFNNNDDWHIINHRGEIVRKVKPFLYNSVLPVVWNVHNIHIDTKTTKLILEAFELNTVLEPLFEISYFIFQDSQLLQGYTSKNFRIEFNPKNDLSEQLTNLKVLVNEFREKEFLPREYLLLQYNEKIFYK